MKRVSTGYQDKILIDGYWYKIDRLGTEGLSEEIATIVLRESNITSAFVEYEYCDFEYRGKLVHGCKSKNFLMPYESIVSLKTQIVSTNRKPDTIKQILHFIYIRCFVKSN